MKAMQHVLTWDPPPGAEIVGRFCIVVRSDGDTIAVSIVRDAQDANAKPILYLMGMVPK
jgi:hypothetical protein